MMHVHLNVTLILTNVKQLGKPNFGVLIVMTGTVVRLVTEQVVLEGVILMVSLDFCARM